MRSVRRLRRPTRLRFQLVATVGVLAGALIGLGVASAKLSANPTIHACVTKKSGALSIASAKGKCAKGTTTLLIDKQGPQGLPGATGVAGPTGPANTEVVDGPVVRITGARISPGQPPPRLRAAMTPSRAPTAKRTEAAP